MGGSGHAWGLAMLKGYGEDNEIYVKYRILTLCTHTHTMLFYVMYIHTGSN